MVWDEYSCFTWIQFLHLQEVLIGEKTKVLLDDFEAEEGVGQD